MRFCTLFIVCSIFFGWGHLRAQENDQKSPNFGISVQVYPAGIISTINLEHYVKEDASLLFRLGMNFTDRQDYSDDNDEEKGEGFGATAGYRRHFSLKRGKLVAGINLDFWNLWIDWRDDIGEINESSGTTYVFVGQPWLEGGYFLDFKNSKNQLGLTLGFGREINLITNGDDVAQDFIGSISLQYMFGF